MYSLPQFLKKHLSDFPGGTVDKNLPANARDTGSIPGPERFHMLWGKKTLALLLLKPACPSLCSTMRETTTTRSPNNAIGGSPPLSTTREGLCTATKTQCNQKLINLNKFLKALLFPTWFQNQMREKKKNTRKRKKEQNISFISDIKFGWKTWLKSGLEMAC